MLPIGIDQAIQLSKWGTLVMRSLFVCLLLLAHSTIAFGRTPALLELVEDGQIHRGRLEAKNRDVCWLLDRDGRLQRVALQSVEKFETVSPRFRPLTAAELRNRMRREFKAPLKVVGTRHYLVCAQGAKAKGYANIFEQVYRTFRRHFSTRGFKIPEPEFPLVALVFPSWARFEEYCEADGLQVPQGLRGYYLRTSNRVALYDPGDQTNAALRGRTPSTQTPRGFAMFAKQETTPELMTCRPAGAGGLRGNLGFASVVNASLESTIIHEATHQLAFNTGLHSRIGENPQWIVEGLATVFEAPGIRDSSPRLPASSRINRERFVWFGNFVSSRREPKSLPDFIKSDELFQSATLDAYSQAWALSFYLTETRSSKYARYLRRVAERDPMSPYPPEQRLDDFEQAFERDLNWLESDFLRFIDRLK